MSNHKADQNQGGIPGWRTMRSDEGHLYATRVRPFSRVAEDEGAFRTVDADDEAGLLEAAQQAEDIAALAESRKPQPIGF